MTDYSAQKAKSDCFEYGIAQGCDEACPVLNRGECEFFKTVEDFLEGVEKE